LKHRFCCQKCHQPIDGGRISLCAHCRPADRFRPSVAYLEERAAKRTTPLPNTHDEQYWRDRERWHDQAGLNRAEAERDR
jgi:hypothetical protein